MQAATLTTTVGLVGHRLKQARERLGVSQKDLSDAMRVPQQHISRWENEKVDPGSFALKQMAQILEVSADFLLGLSDSTGDNADYASLPPLQRKLLWLIDNGQIVEAIQTLTTFPQGDD